MNASRTSPRRRFLPLLTICSTLTAFNSFARADLLVSQPIDQPAAGEARLSPRMDYRTASAPALPTQEAGMDGRVAAGALAVVLVLPPGITPVAPPVVISTPPPPPPPPPPSPPPPTQTPPPIDGGGGHPSGGPSSPEPASLVLALTGSAMAGAFGVIRRRRRSAIEVS